MSSAPRSVSSLGSPGPAPMMYTRIAIPLGAAKHRVANDVPDGGRNLSEPARRDDVGQLAVVLVVLADHQPPQPLADRPGARDDERGGEQAGERLALDLDGQLRHAERGRSRRSEPREPHAGPRPCVELTGRLESGGAPVARDLGIADQVVVAAGLGEDRAREAPDARHHSTSSAGACTGTASPSTSE